MYIESCKQTYLNNEITAAHIIADRVCTWRFNEVLDIDGDYAWQFVVRANDAATIKVLLGDQEYDFDVTTEFHKYIHVFSDVVIESHPHVDVEFAPGEYFIGRTQLEHGNIITDWQRSRDDEQTQITELWSAITQTAEEIRSEVRSSYTVVNLVPITYSRQAASGNEWRPSNGTLGLKWVLNGDGSVTATPLTSGAATTAQSAYAITGYSLKGAVAPITVDPDKKYTITGCPSGGSSSSYYIRVRCFYAIQTPSESATFVDGQTQFYDYGDGVTIPSGFKYLTVHLVVASGYIIPSDGLTFFPMVVSGDAQYPYTQPNNGSVSVWSSITQTADKIALVVDSSNEIRAAEIVAAINDNGDSSVYIAADKIKLEGYTSINNYFTVDENGRMTASGGEIAGWTIGTRRLESVITTEDNGVTTYTRSGMQSLNSQSATPYNAAFFAGCTTASGENIVSNSAFVVRHNGEMVAKRVTLGGSDKTFGPYTAEDYQNASVYAMGYNTGAITDITPYDINEDNALDSTDVNFINTAYQITGDDDSAQTIIRTGQIVINPDDNSFPLRVKRTYTFGDGSTETDIPFKAGPKGIETLGYVNAGLHVKAPKFYINNTQLGNRTYVGNESTAISVANETWCNAGSTGFADGIYFVEYVAEFSANVNGYRHAVMSTDIIAGNTPAEKAGQDIRMAITTSGVKTYVRIFHIYQFTTSNNTRYFHVYQNSGSTLDVYYRLYVSKIA